MPRVLVSRGAAPPGASRSGVSRPLLLGLFVLGGAGLVRLASSGEGRTSARAPGSADAPAEPASGEALAGAAPSREERRPLTGGAGEPGWSAARAVGSAADPAAGGVAEAPRSEREWLESFRALARAEPGALEARAAAILAGEDPPPAKVALLRVLREEGSPEAVRWLAESVRTQPDEARPEARSLPSFALEALAEEAARPRGEPALAALESLAFDEPGLSPGLRRRAASAYALRCGEAGLDALRSRLLREPDALLVAGALASLGAREPSPRSERILRDFPAAAAPEGHESDARE